MAESMVHGEFWLPSQFLSEGDFTVEKIAAMGTQKKDGFGAESENEYSQPGFLNGEFNHGFGPLAFSSSDLSSPVESSLGSLETESDEEDYMAELTLQMATSTLEEDSCKQNSVNGNRKVRVSSRSPQSPLCAMESGCGCKPGSANVVAQLSHPTATWDLLYAAAGEVAKMRMNSEAFGFSDNCGLVNGKPFCGSLPLNSNSPDFPLFLPQPFSRPQIQCTSHFEHLKQQQMKQQGQGVWRSHANAAGQFLQQSQSVHSLVRNKVCHQIGANRCGAARPLGLSASACSPLQQNQQQQSGSGMRAVFLGTPGSRRGCAGTGVFLPRRVGCSSELRKKPACSTVLLPAKVVQALNLNLDGVGGAQNQTQTRFNACFTPDGDARLKLRRGGASNFSPVQQKRSLRPAAAVAAVSNNEIRLPQDWTY